jgi:hypothetical protein
VNRNVDANANQNQNVNRNVDANVNQNANVNRNVNADVNRNVNVNSNVDVDRHVDVDVDDHYHGHGDYHHDDDDDNFWGGFAAGAVTTMAVGAVVRSVPDNSQPVVVNNVNYVVADGVYYQQSGDGYTVVNPPAGQTVTALPPGAVQTTLDGQVAYQANGIYYQPVMQNGATVYKTVAH